MSNPFDVLSQFDRLASSVFDAARTPRLMPVDLFRDGDQYVLSADLPGIDPVVLPLARCDFNDGAVRTPSRVPADRGTSMALTAAQSAWAASGLDMAGLDAERVGLYWGSGMAGAHSFDASCQTLYGEHKRLRPTTVLSTMPNAAVAEISLQLGIRPEFVTVQTAASETTLPVKVERVEDLGNYKLLTARFGPHQLKAKMDEDAQAPGETAQRAPEDPGDLLVVYDAEDAPEDDQLLRAAALFHGSAPDVACLQARLAITNVRDGFLSRRFAIDYAALFDCIKAGMGRAEWPVPLGGSALGQVDDRVKGLRAGGRSAKRASLATCSTARRSASVRAWAGRGRRVVGRRSPRTRPSSRFQRCSVRSVMPATLQAASRRAPARWATSMFRTFIWRSSRPIMRPRPCPSERSPRAFLRGPAAPRPRPAPSPCAAAPVRVP